MVSEHPLPDRCGAKVVDNVGLEIHLKAGEGEKRGAYTITDEQLERIRLIDPETDVVVEGPTIYKDIREYLWNDYTLASVGFEKDTWDPTDTALGTYMRAGSTQTPDTYITDERDGLRWYRFGDDVTIEKITNSHSDLQGFCERYPMDNGRCYVHQPGSGAPEGNTNGLTHGLYAQRTNFYGQLEDDEKAFVESMVDEWIEMSPYERDNQAIINELYRTAIDQLRAWYGVEEFTGEEGLTKEQIVGVDEEGKPQEMIDEHPANLPYSRLDRDIQSKLKELSIYESPEKQQADATESLAQKLSGLGKTD